MIRHVAVIVGGIASLGTTPPPGQDRGPIIDMHLHAYPADAQGPPPTVVCAPYDTMPSRDPRRSNDDYAVETFKPRSSNVKSPAKASAERVVNRGFEGCTAPWGRLSLAANH
jgi:hypothetical protein